MGPTDATQGMLPGTPGTPRHLLGFGMQAMTVVMTVAYIGASIVASANHSELFSSYPCWSAAAVACHGSKQLQERVASYAEFCAGT